jgi:hypothetical protein
MAEESAKEFGLWKRNPITKAIFEEFQQRKEDLEKFRDDLTGDPELDTIEKVGLSYIVISARIRQIEDFLSVSVEDVEDQIEDD